MTYCGPSFLCYNYVSLSGLGFIVMAAVDEHSPSFWAKEDFTRVTTKNVKVKILVREDFARISEAIRDVRPSSISPISPWR